MAIEDVVVDVFCLPLYTVEMCGGAWRDAVHSLESTTVKVHDSRVWDELLHGEETSVWADKG